ncbi:MAG TPA: FAD-dependent oxidoreductase [Chloroflexota bacterium]|nr:FAD-dependent oxidoreductase [Chloroflexota bacterium]
MSDTYDLVVIGAGSGGLSAATFAAELGARVALVDRDRPGGDCLATGCVPSKTLLKVAKVAWEMRHADRFALSSVTPEIDLARVNAHVQATIERVYQFERPEVLRDKGIDFFTGGARFVDSEVVAAGERTLRGGHFLVCTGARPISPNLPGLQQVPFLSYEAVFHLDALPEHLIVLGTGPIGVELAQAFARLGSQVTVIGRSGRVLGRSDPAVQAVVAAVLRDDGVDLRLQGPAEEVAPLATGGLQVTTSQGAVAGDALLVALGRRPNVEGLDLDRARVAYSDQGILVNTTLRTTNPRIFACGDVVGGPQFSHYAAWQGYIAVRNAILPGTSRGILAYVPWAVFTDPEVATVGLTEPAAREHYGNDLVVRQLPLDHVDRAQTDGETRGLVKVVARRNGEILGAHVVASRAGEMIQEYVLAMNHGIRLDQLASAIHVYPTYATANQQVAADFWTERLLTGLKGRVIRLLARLA